jgi:hypothetical protein
LKRKEPQQSSVPSNTELKPPQEKYDVLQQRQQLQPAVSRQLPFHQQQVFGQPAQQLRPTARVQAYAAFNQRDAQSDDSNDGYDRRNSHDDFAAASELEAGLTTSERSSRGSSVGAEVGIIDDEGRFISTLMSAQQARMRVYV